MHGYELRKRLNLMLGWGRILSYGSLYPALKKMLRSNLIERGAAAASTDPPPTIITGFCAPRSRSRAQDPVVSPIEAAAALRLAKSP